MKIDNYNFESDFYYLEYPLPRTSTLGTIYRHYLNNYIEFIHGCTEQQPERLEDEKKRYEIITALEYLKKLTTNLTLKPSQKKNSSKFKNLFSPYPILGSLRKVSVQL